MEYINPQQTETFIQACRQIAEYNLARCSSGNLSWRLNNQNVALTAGGAWFANLQPAQIAVCSLADGTSLNNVRPSIESQFHLGIMRNRPEVNVVLHFQSPYAAAVACGPCQDYNYNMTIEAPVYIGDPAIIDYLSPGSSELARAVVAALTDHDIGIMRNHGLVTVGTDFPDAIQKAAFFELNCQILLTQPNPQPISRQDAQNLTQA